MALLTMVGTATDSTDGVGCGRTGTAPGSKGKHDATEVGVSVPCTWKLCSQLLGDFCCYSENQHLHLIQ